MVVSISASELTVQAAAAQVRVLGTANDFYLCFSSNSHCLIYESRSQILHPEIKKIQVSFAFNCIDMDQF